MTPEQETACLAVNPFDGDRDSDARELSDKIVTTRKATTCVDCGQPIAIGERSRVITAAIDGRVASCRWCALCCIAMGLDDYAETWIARMALRPQGAVVTKEAT